MRELWELEESYYGPGVQTLCGVDEAGRGPLAGPVCAAAVILPRGLEIPGLDDSKKLTDRRRRELYEVIIKEAAAYGIALVDERTIDEINILQATFRAMGEAVSKLEIRPDLTLVDGNREPALPMTVRTVVGGDGSIPNTASRYIRATEPSATLRPCRITARAPSTGCPF